MIDNEVAIRWILEGICSEDVNDHKWDNWSLVSETDEIHNFHAFHLIFIFLLFYFEELLVAPLHFRSSIGKGRKSNCTHPILPQNPWCHREWSQSWYFWTTSKYGIAVSKFRTPDNMWHVRDRLCVLKETECNLKRRQPLFCILRDAVKLFNLFWKYTYLSLHCDLFQSNFAAFHLLSQSAQLRGYLNLVLFRSRKCRDWRSTGIGQ